MDPAIKKVAILLAAALIVVIGLIAVVHSTQAKKAEVATETGNAQVIAEAENTQAPTAHEPKEEAEASQEDVTMTAQNHETAQENDLYEGALAGLSEEEIAKMAMAEEQSKARTEMGENAEESVD